MFNSCYIEITNVCNLSCSFCIGTKRTPKFLSASEFEIIAKKVRPFTDYIYLHLMGEPMLNGDLEAILKIADSLGFRVNITTNGTLISKWENVILSSSAMRKISFSLHSFEGNGGENLVEYLTPIWNFCEKSRLINELRLWNGGGANTLNEKIAEYIEKRLNKSISDIPYIKGSKKIAKHIYLSAAEKFEWPDESASLRKTEFCQGLKTHFGVLCDGTVVPCCLDSNGTIALGNIFESELSDILSSERAVAIIEGFQKRCPSEELCRHCGYASRF